MPPIMNQSEIPTFNHLSEVNSILTGPGCRMCSLGFQESINGCCVMRGSYKTKKMIVGEAPGKHEDADGLPFTGPAGKLLDKIWQSVDMQTSDWYLTNIVLCRPAAPYGSGKENFTPKQGQRDRCRPYLDAQIRLLKPWIIVPVGRPATEAVLGVKGIRMGDFRGMLINRNIDYETGQITDELPTIGGSVTIFPMLHPAAILHATGTDNYDKYRVQMWEDVKALKKITKEVNA